MTASRGAHRIGEFARRVGVSPELLRAWEQRYGVLQPVRSAGGFRLYTEEDADRVAQMQRGLADGLSAAEAARVALDGAAREGEAPARALAEDARARLLAAVEGYDEAALQTVLDDAVATLGLEPLLRDVILPALDEIGRRWAAGRTEVSQEHFASNVIRGRMLSLARLWGRGSGPLALLACVPGEEHDISLLAFGLLLRSHGWRVLFLGADTPISTLKATAQLTGPAAIVLAAFDPRLLESEATGLRQLARIAPLFLSGPGATASGTRLARVRRLDGDVVAAAESLARMSNE